MLYGIYEVVGKRAEELLHTAGYLKQAFGDDIIEITHQIGEHKEHIYHFGKSLGDTTVVISKISNKVLIDIAGEGKGHMKTKSELEKKFEIKLK
ncbi:MAG: hypothetical protein PHH54_03070 [Candidatus Nanoarchaeia archaeon]|nr:hypothetical protein [Candidatus Nanoarchaeia archaeon]MDD5740942.1 hypothetical protein [Candidatus Nanoarchaeia archaeon]